MSIARTRPPGHPRSGRRTPPEGPRPVPRAAKKTASLRERATAAANKLRDIGEPDMAEAVDQLISGRRWDMHTPAGTTVSMWIDAALKKRAQDAPEPVADVVTEGLNKFLAGEFVPPTPKRARRGEGGGKTSLTPRIDPDLWQRVTEYGEAHAEELGWKPVASQVAVAYLAARYPAPQDDTPAAD